MAGKLCDGVTTHVQKTIVNSRAFCEGLAHRSSDTAANAPVTDNPHAAASDAGVAWIAGWDLADGAAGGPVDPADAPCCAVSGADVLA